MAKKSSSNGDRSVADCMTPNPVALLETETIVTAAQAMRENDIGDVIVLDDTGGRLKGIVTDRDVVVRAVADAKDPEQVTLGSIATTDVMCVSPDDSLDEVSELMRERAIRRVPVVEDDRPVGILSIGDLAQQLDKKSALAEISAAPAND